MFLFVCYKNFVLKYILSHVYTATLTLFGCCLPGIFFHSFTFNLFVPLTQHRSLKRQQTFQFIHVWINLSTFPISAFLFNITDKIAFMSAICFVWYVLSFSSIFPLLPSIVLHRYCLKYYFAVFLLHIF